VGRPWVSFGLTGEADTYVSVWRRGGADSSVLALRTCARAVEVACAYPAAGRWRTGGTRRVGS